MAHHPKTGSAVASPLQAPAVQHGQRNDAEVVADPHTGQKARFNLPISGDLPADAVTRPEGKKAQAPAASDLGSPKDEPGVWEAAADKPKPGV
jgi:hypothetical protein